MGVMICRSGRGMQCFIVVVVVAAAVAVVAVVVVVVGCCCCCCSCSRHIHMVQQNAVYYDFGG